MCKEQHHAKSAATHLNGADMLTNEQISERRDSDRYDDGEWAAGTYRADIGRAA